MTKKNLNIKDIKNSNGLKLIHNDVNGFNIDVIEEQYKAKYVGEFCLKSKSGEWYDQAFSLFYNPTPHPQGSNYFALYYMYDYDTLINDKIPKVYITDGISAVQDKQGTPVIYIAAMVDDNQAIYSAYRHDSQSYNDVMIDGGRDYHRGSLGSKLINFIIEDSEIKLVGEQEVE